MQIRLRVAGLAVASTLAMAGLGLALAGPSVAATTAPPTPSAQPASTAPIPPTEMPSAVASPVPPQASGGIDVPAGNAIEHQHRDGSTTVLIVGLVAGGVALAGAGSVLVARRRP
jgi:hypothetical protein